MRAKSFDLPPLARVLHLLNPSSQKLSGYDHFNLSDEEVVDYALLKCHVDILGRVLTNIPQYVAREAKTKGNAPAVSVSDLLKRIETLLTKLAGTISELLPVKMTLTRWG